MPNTNTCKTCRYFTPGHPMLANAVGTCGHHSTPVKVENFLDPTGSGILIPTEVTIEDRSTSPDSTCSHHQELFLTQEMFNKLLSMVLETKESDFNFPSINKYEIKTGWEWDPSEEAKRADQAEKVKAEAIEMERKLLELSTERSGIKEELWAKEETVQETIQRLEDCGRRLGQKLESLKKELVDLLKVAPP